jgi:hypothetical protein
MVTEEDAEELLSALRGIVQEKGFESFDAHVATLILASADSGEPIRTAERALIVYSKIVSRLLRSVGAARIRKARENIAEALELDDITIELELTEIQAILLGGNGNMELTGIRDADQLADEIEQFANAVHNFSYPDPDSGPTRGGPSP